MSSPMAMETMHTTGDSSSSMSVVFGLLHALQSEICMFVAAAVVYLLVSSRLPSTAKRTAKGISKKCLDESSGDEEASKAKKMAARRAAGSTAPGASRRAGNAAEQEALHLERNAKSIREFGKAGNLQAAIDAFASIKLGCSTMSSSLAYNSVIDACVQCTEMQMALKYLAEVKELGLADVVSYNTIIKGLLSSGDMDSVNGLLTEMAQHGVLASHVTFHSVLHVSVQSGDKDAAWRWLSQMRQAGLAPTCRE